MKHIIELERKNTDQDYCDIILCVITDDECKARDGSGFVTWVENLGYPDKVPYKVMGHYFNDIRAALRDFNKRT